jgi:hypothetical protein
MVKEEDLKGYLRNSCKGAHWSMYGDVTSIYIVHNKMTRLCHEWLEDIDSGINPENIIITLQFIWYLFDFSGYIHVHDN